MLWIDDLLYAFTEWLRTTPLVNLALWIADQPLSQSMGSKFLTIPLLQTIHILSIATAFSAVLMVNLRVLGLVGAGQTMLQTTRRYAPWIWGALAALVATGIGLVIAEPVRELINPIFWIKMGLIVAVVLLSIGFQTTLRRSFANRDQLSVGTTAARVGAIGLILLWCAVIFAGRWIAYAPT
jgi:uncharacterized membrane protein